MRKQAELDSHYARMRFDDLYHFLIPFRPWYLSILIRSSVLSRRSNVHRHVRVIRVVPLHHALMPLLPVPDDDAGPLVPLDDALVAHGRVADGHARPLVPLLDALVPHGAVGDGHAGPLVSPYQALMALRGGAIAVAGAFVGCGEAGKRENYG